MSMDSSGEVTFPDIGKTGNCMGDALKEYDLKFKYLRYSSGDDKFTLEMEALFLKIKVTLYHEGMVIEINDK